MQVISSVYNRVATHLLPENSLTLPDLQLLLLMQKMVIYTIYYCNNMHLLWLLQATSPALHCSPFPTPVF